MKFNGDFKNNTTKYSKKEIINTLHEKLPSVFDYSKERKIISNKYIDLAIKHQYKNYRMCTIGDIHSLGLLRSFTDNQKQFFNDNGEFLVIFNEIGGKPISIVLRSLKQKQFIDFSVFYNAYGIDMIDSDFKYGDWLILTEGIYDADSFRIIYNNVLAMLTSNITLMQTEVLSTLTNKFILAFDNDAAGIQGVEIAKKKLNAIIPGCEIEVLTMYARDKDLGTMEEKINKIEDYNVRKEYYSAIVRFIVDKEGLTW